MSDDSDDTQCKVTLCETCNGGACTGNSIEINITPNDSSSLYEIGILGGSNGSLPEIYSPPQDLNSTPFGYYTANSS